MCGIDLLMYIFPQVYFQTASVVWSCGRADECDIQLLVVSVSDKHNYSRVE